MKKLSVLSEGQRFMKFASGAYGWPLLYGLSKEKLGLEKVKNISGGLVREARSSHLAALLKHTGVLLEHVIEAKWKSENFDNGHLIVLDHSRKEIVVAFRGTMEIKDRTCFTFLENH